jgi:hypothetical protein
MYVLFFAIPLCTLARCEQEKMIRRFDFGDAIILKKSQEDACAAAYEVHRKISLQEHFETGSHRRAEYAVCTLTLTKAAWTKLESMAAVQHTYWLSLPGYRIAADLALDAETVLKHIHTEAFH